MGSETHFQGFAVTRSGSTDSHTLILTCYNRGFYLKRNHQHIRQGIPLDTRPAERALGEA